MKQGPYFDLIGAVCTGVLVSIVLLFIVLAFIKYT